MKARYYLYGQAFSFGQCVNVTAVGQFTLFETELDDGRTIQLAVHDDGVVRLTCWGNFPLKVGNMEQASFAALITPQSPAR